MKYDLTIYVGHNVEGKPRHDSDKITKAVREQLKVDGFTAFEAWGDWRGEKERSTVIKICAIEENRLAEIQERQIPALCYYLNQESILIEAVASTAALVYPCSSEEFAAANIA